MPKIFSLVVSVLALPFLVGTCLYRGSDLAPKYLSVDTMDTVEGVCNVFLPYTWFLGFPEFSGYHQWQQESQ